MDTYTHRFYLFEVLILVCGKYLLEGTYMHMCFLHCACGQDCYMYTYFSGLLHAWFSLHVTYSTCSYSLTLKLLVYILL